MICKLGSSIVFVVCLCVWLLCSSRVSSSTGLSTNQLKTGNAGVQMCCLKVDCANLWEKPAVCSYQAARWSRQHRPIHWTRCTNTGAWTPQCPIWIYVLSLHLVPSCRLHWPPSSPHRTSPDNDITYIQQSIIKYDLRKYSCNEKNSRFMDLLAYLCS